MSIEQPFIDLINASPEDDFPKLMYADWLEEGGECELAEGWRVLVQEGERPEFYQDDWNWWQPSENEDVFPKHSQLSFPTHLSEWFNRSYETHFESMQEAVLAYVRHTYDSEYARETKTGYCQQDT